MARHLLFRRALTPDIVYSATEEEGLTVDAMTELSRQGKMRAYAGGEPSDESSFVVGVGKGGNLGDAEWGISPDSITFRGVPKPWIPERPTFIDDIASLYSPQRLIWDHTRNRAFLVYGRSTTLSYRIWTPTTRTWSEQKNIVTITAGAAAAVALVPDTGELLIFCDGIVHSSFNPTAATPTWVEKGTISDYTGGTDSMSPAMVIARGRLVVLWVEDDSDTDKVHSAISYDMGFSFQATTMPSGLPGTEGRASGTCTAGGDTTTLKDTSATFESEDISNGDQVRNTTTATQAGVVTVDSDTQITTGDIGGLGWAAPNLYTFERQAGGIHAAVSPLDGNIYLVVIRVEDITAPEDYAINIYRSGSGSDWELWVEDLGGFGGGSAQILTEPCLAFDESGFMTLFFHDHYTQAAPELYQVAALRLSTSGELLDTIAILDDVSLLFEEEWEGVAAVHCGQEVLAVGRYNPSSGSDMLIDIGTKWWSAISETASFNGDCWMTNPNQGPADDFAWVAVGNAGAETLADLLMTLTTNVTNTERYYQASGGSFGTVPYAKLKFGFKAGVNNRMEAQMTGIRVQKTDAPHGCHFRIAFDDTGVRIWDESLAGGSGDWACALEAIDLTAFVDFMVDIQFDETNGGATVSLWYRERSSPISLASEEWTLAFGGDVAIGDVDPSADETAFGHFSYWSTETISYWDYFYTGNTLEGADENYANTTADPSSLSGKICSRLPQHGYAGLDVFFGGAGAYPLDAWTAQTRYHWAKKNVMRADPKRQWRTQGDGAEKTIVFHDDDDRPFRPAWVSLFKKNFDRFYIEMDNAVTFDSDSGSPQVSINIDDGTSADHLAQAYTCPYLEVDSVYEDWIVVAWNDARTAAMWAGRFNQDSISGRRYWVRVLDNIAGSASGNVYLIESVERNGVDWVLRLARDASGNPVTALSDGLAATDHIGIFGENIAIEIGNYLLSGYKYLRIRIPSQQTTDNDYRIGTVVFGSATTFETYYETKEPEWNTVVSNPPNIGALTAPDNSNFVRRKGPAARLVSLSWSGAVGREMLVNPISALLEACAGDGTVVYIDQTHLHNGPIEPKDAMMTSYDPILCRVEGTIDNKLDARYYNMDTGYIGAIIGNVNSINGLLLREIV